VRLSYQHGILVCRSGITSGIRCVRDGRKSLWRNVLLRIPKPQVGSSNLPEGTGFRHITTLEHTVLSVLFSSTPSKPRGYCSFVFELP